MIRLTRSAVALAGAAVLVAGGCEQKTETTAAAPQSAGYGTKLVGVWEGKEPGNDKQDPVTVEFAAGGTCKFSKGKDEMPGTWKIAREGGHKMQVDITLTPPGKKDAETKAFMADFRDEDTLILSPMEKEDPIELKRKK
ncbi:MAG TPA: hypothetical protein VM597_03815 [Gemmataceae bacterium]|jgi:hypothetical protein|nr:hypothetical protein [Gemmataceae bacterium]